MRKERTALWLAVLLIAAVGCGSKEEQLVESGEMIVTPQDNGSSENAEGNENEEEDRENEEENNGEVSDDNNTDDTNESSKDESNDSFEGMVKEINDKENFVVVSKIFTEEIDGGMEGSVSLATDGEDMITVYFTDNTRFKIKTVKNAGEEVTEKEGAFSDIKKESTLEFKGKMDAKGEEFLADEVIIFEFIYS